MVYRFGDCRLDPAARQLTRHGREQRLSTKAFELLVLLLEARPRVVTKAQVMQAIWPGTFVSDANIAVLVSELRGAVGDSARESRIVKTRSRIGYCFVAVVTEIGEGDASPTTHRTPVLSISGRRVVLPVGISTLGRDTSCAVHLSDPSVSRFHARVVIEGTTARIEDAGSKNGVLVDGRRVAGSMVLRSGAAITLGTVDLVFEFEEEAVGSTWSIP